MRSSLHQRVAARPTLIGLLQAYPHPTVTEIAGWCEYDFIFFDGEHGLFTEADILEGLRVAAGVGLLGAVRAAGHDLAAIGRYLDMGADIIVVPGVSKAEQAQSLAGALVYPPTGTRGVGASLHRATRYGFDAAAYLKAPRGEASLLVIIESALGAANAEEILAVEGVDGVIIGPADLSADLGWPGDFTQPQFAAAIARIEKAALAAGKVLGCGPHGASTIEALIARGHRFLLVGSDVGLMREAMTAQVAKARAAIEAGAASREENS